MTTIAYREGVLAADTRMCRGGFMLPGDAIKLRKLSDGSICGIVGDFAKIDVFVKWWNDGQQGFPTMGADSTVIVVNHDKSLTIFECDGSHDLHCDFAAFGSGMGPALAALHLGASVEKAVETAMLVDPGTGGAVKTLTVGD